MIYYLIFCITTTIMILWKCQIPAWRMANKRKNIKAYVFWAVLIALDMLFAPVFFVVLLSAADLYKQIILEKLNNEE